MFRIFHVLPYFLMGFSFASTLHAANLGIGGHFATADLKSPESKDGDSYFLQGFEFRGGLNLSPDAYGEIKALSIVGEDGESRAQLAGLSFGIKWNGDMQFVTFRPGLHAGLVTGLIVDDNPGPGELPEWGQATTAMVEPELDIVFKLSPIFQFYLSGSWRLHLVGPEWTSSFDGLNFSVGVSFPVGGTIVAYKEKTEPLTFEDNKKKPEKKAPKKIRRNDAEPPPPEENDSLDPADIPENPEEDPYGSDLPASNVNDGALDDPGTDGGDPDLEEPKVEDSDGL